MLILDKNLSYDNLKLLSKINDDTDNINVCEYVEKNNLLISYDSKIIETQNNSIMIEAQRNLIDLFVGFVSDYSIIKIDIFYEVNDNMNLITSVIPKTEYVDIITESNPELAILIHLNNSDNIEKIEKVNKKIYKLQNVISLNPYFRMFYKLYFDENTDIFNNKLYDVGIFIHEHKLRSFVMSQYMIDIY